MKPQIYLLLIGFLLVFGCTESEEEDESTTAQKPPAFIGSWIIENVTVGNESRDEFKNARWTFGNGNFPYAGYYQIENLPDEENELEDISYSSWYIDPNMKNPFYFLTYDKAISFYLRNEQLSLIFDHYAEDWKDVCPSDTCSSEDYPQIVWFVTLSRDDSNDQ